MTRHPLRRAAGVLPVAVLLFVCPGVSGQDADPAATLVARAGRYVREWEQRFTGIVGEEQQTQRIVKATGATKKQRNLVSDILIVKVGDGPVFFRDVIVVDGKAVRGRQERLRKLFLGTSRDPMKQAHAIFAESRRYDLRQVRLPVTFMSPLRVLKPGTSDRFQFAATDEGVSFDEVGSPSLAYTLNRGVRRDLLQHGRLSIDAASGAPRFAHLMAVNALIESSVEVRYVEDARLGLFVPTQVLERHRRPARPEDDQLDISSDYSNFRRFEVIVEERLALPK